MTRITFKRKRPRVADRPRRCGCGIPVVETVDGVVLDDRPATRGQAHDECWWEWIDLGEGDA